MNFFISKTDEKETDHMNYLFDLECYGYAHANHLAFLFNYFYNSQKSTA